MKADPKELHDFAIDIGKAIESYPDAMKHNPDIHTAAKNLRDAARTKYEEVSESRYPHKRDDYIP